jgi:hypothetical protein
MVKKNYKVEGKEENKVKENRQKWHSKARQLRGNESGDGKGGGQQEDEEGRSNTLRV